MSSLPRRSVRRTALSLAALSVVAPLSTVCAQDAVRPTPPVSSRAERLAPAAADGAAKFDAGFLDSTPNAGDDGGRFAPDAMDLRAGDGAANYGKPVLKRPGQKPTKKPPAPGLQRLVPYSTSAEARRALRLQRASGDPVSVAPSPTVAALPTIPAKPRPRVEDQPFAPVGIDVGLLRVKGYVESDIGYNDNPNSRPAGQARASAFTREEVGLAGASDWNNHSFIGALRLGYNDYFNAHEADAPDGDGRFLARIDVARDLKINVDGNYRLSTQNSSSPNLVNGGLLLARPIVANYGGGIGVTKKFNRLELTLRGSVDRTYWGNAQFANGTTQYLSGDSYVDYGLTGRVAYELTPGIKPFVESTIDTRLRDSATDTAGYQRDSQGVLGKVGSTFELSQLLVGEIALGYGERHYQDPRLIPLRGALLDSSLVWTVTPLTKVTLRGASSMDETTIAGSPGSLTQVASLELSHALMRNLVLKATGSATLARYEQVNINQTTYQAGLAAEYNLTRTVTLKGSFTQQRLVANQGGTDYTANIIMVGLRLQR